MQPSQVKQLDFSTLKTAIAESFRRLCDTGALFRTTADKDGLWETYLNSFPAGTNPIYRKRTCHDGSYDRQFIRAIGNVVAIVDNKVVSLWDMSIPAEPAYQVVADKLAAFVKSFPIDNEFLHTEAVAGVDKSYESRETGVHTWYHFFVNIPNGRGRGKNYVVTGKDIGPRLSETRSRHDVLLRSLTELTSDSLETVLELIAQNSLYRGAEHEATVTAFQKLKKAFDTLPLEERDPFVWSSLNTLPVSVSKIRNTSIGTLLIDLSEGLEIDAAVRKFEAVVAPANYKRPTALVTQKMVDKAKEELSNLGLLSALERRHATLHDVSINDILFANRTAGKALKDSDVFGAIATKTSAAKAFSKAEEVNIEKFISDILPHINTIELLFESRHSGNLVSLLSPKDATANALFKWDNNFTWSYNGNVTDSIKERVKQAGGNVTGDLCCRLSWFNYDDLDLHLVEPGNVIYYGAKRSPISGGQLDVDRNAGTGTTREPVENIFFSTRQRMKPGDYELRVNNFAKRETTDVGFEVEIEYLGQTYHFAYAKPLRDKETVTVAKFRYSHAEGLKITSSLPVTSRQKTLWGLKTEDFHNVNVLMLSPNYWGNQGTGNKHYLFMLSGCKNDTPTRGFFNEFLRNDLNQHRKVLEIVGGKMVVEPAEEQLSGLGFSSTQRNSVTAKLSGSFNRTINLTF